MREIIMLSVLLPASLWDLYSDRIPNWIVVSGWVAILYFNYVTYGKMQMWYSVISVGVILFIGGIIYVFGGIGAGDVKLISVVAGMYSLKFAGRVVFIVAIFAGVISVIKLIRNGSVYQRYKSLCRQVIYGGDLRCYIRDKTKDTLYIRLAPVVSMAYFLALCV